MPYELLFSRNRSNDVPVVWSDIEILESSLMVDALSILSQFRRSAGWLYPVRPTGTGSFERGQGRLILFGKTRVNFPDFPPPYYLEFFPRFGCSTYVLSVYKGQPVPPRPPVITFPNGQAQIYRSSLGGSLFVSESATAPFIRIVGSEGSLSAKVGGDGRLFIEFGPSNYRYSLGPPWTLLTMSRGTWNQVIALPGVRDVPSS
jgi:hypothetical protein